MGRDGNGHGGRGECIDGDLWNWCRLIQEIEMDGMSETATVYRDRLPACKRMKMDGLGAATHPVTTHLAAACIEKIYKTPINTTILDRKKGNTAS